MKRLQPGLIALLLILIALFGGAFVYLSLRERPSLVVRVVDGDTIVLKTGETIRLIGINAPELGNRFWHDSKEALSLLLEGRQVTLEKDVQDKDAYGRLLRYVWLDNKLINEEIVRQGRAIAYIVEPNIRYKERIIKAEEYARNQKIGMWDFVGEPCSHICIGIYKVHEDAEGDDRKNLNDEYILFKNICSHECDLSNWTISDEVGHTFKFKEFVLGSRAKFTLYTGKGKDTKTSVFWNSATPIWDNDHDTITMRNAEGKIVISLSY